MRFYRWSLFLFLIGIMGTIFSGTTGSARNLFGSEEIEKTRVRLEEWIGSVPPSAPSDVNVICAEQRRGKAILLKPGGDWNRPEAVVWDWEPSDSPEISPDHYGWFGYISEVKPVLGGSALLTVSSAGGVALVRLSDKKALFYAHAGGNTHSAALLPDGNIVTASSNGNYLRLFVVPEKFVSADEVKSETYPFTDTHGVVWDKAREILWVLGGEEIAGYRYSGPKESPSLTRVFIETLPEELSGGHDLYPLPDSGTTLIFTTNRGIGIFDTQEREIALLDPIQHVKSVSLNPEGGLIVMVPKEEWWSDSILYWSTGTPEVGTLSDARFYKARWWLPNHFSE